MIGLSVVTWRRGRQSSRLGFPIRLSQERSPYHFNIIIPWRHYHAIIFPLTLLTLVDPPACAVGWRPAQDIPPVQELRRLPGSRPERCLILLKELKKGQILTAFLENTSGNLDPILSILPGDQDLSATLEASKKPWLTWWPHRPNRCSTCRLYGINTRWPGMTIAAPATRLPCSSLCRRMATITCLSAARSPLLAAQPAGDYRLLLGRGCSPGVGWDR